MAGQLTSQGLGDGYVTRRFPEDVSGSSQSVQPGLGLRTTKERIEFFTEIACLIPGHYEAGMKGLVDFG